MKVQYKFMVSVGFMLLSYENVLAGYFGIGVVFAILGMLFNKIRMTNMFEIMVMMLVILVSKFMLLDSIGAINNIYICMIIFINSLSLSNWFKRFVSIKLYHLYQVDKVVNVFGVITTLLLIVSGYCSNILNRELFVIVIAVFGYIIIIEKIVLFI